MTFDAKKLSSITTQFFGFQELIESSPFGSGHINDTFKITLKITGHPKSFLLQRINHRVFRNPEAVMRNIQLVADHLSASTYSGKVLAPVLTLKKELFYLDENENYWRVFPFFENTRSFQKVENERQAFEAARAFGAFFKALTDLEIQQLKVTIPNFHNGLKRLKNFEKAVEKARIVRSIVSREEVDFILAHQTIFQKIAALKLPERTTHNDTKINNLLFDSKGEKAVAVIDLDTLMPGTILSDFGDMARTFTNAADEDASDLTKVEMRQSIFTALHEGFLSETGSILTEVEKENLFEGAKWMTLMQALRFLTDFLEGDVYYKIKYPEHNLVRARNQLALFRSMIDRG